MNTVNSASIGAVSNDISADRKTIPLTPLQQGYFVGRRSDFDLHVHPHLYLEFDLDKCDIRQLEKAITELVNNHPMFRSTILRGAEIVFREEFGDYRIVQHDLSKVSNEDNLELALNKVRKCLKRFDFDSQSIGIDVRVSTKPRGLRIHINIDLLLFDGSSVRSMLRELSFLYTEGGAKSEGDISSINSNKHVSKYSDYLNNYYSDEQYERSKKYWYERLKTFPDELQLPVNPNMLLMRRSKLERRKYILSKEKWAVFCERCMGIDANPSTVLFTLYSIVVSYWSKYQHFYLTMMLQGDARQREDLEDICANTARTILVEIDHRNIGRLGDRLRQVRNQVFRDITRSRFCGLEVLNARNRSDLAVARMGSPVAFVSMLAEHGESIPDSLFQLENNNMVFSSLETPQVILDHQAISRPDGGVSLVWDCVDEVLEENVAQDMYVAYTTLVEKVISEPDIWEKDSYDLRSKQQVIRHKAYNETNVQTEGRLLQFYLYESAKKFPDKALIIDGTTVISYEQSRRVSNQLAWTLRGIFNIKANDLVAVCLPKSWEQIIVIQAILAAGAAYVPIMPWLPYERKRFILSSCRCSVVITDKQNTTEAFSDLATLYVDDQRLVNEVDNLPAIQTSDDMAYIVFTSGSTGTPKGVVLDHHGPSNTIDDIHSRFGITENDCLIGISEISFDLSVYDIFGTIKAGATLVLPTDGERHDPKLCLNLIEKHKVTVWNSVPALAQLFFDYLELSGKTVSHPLRLVMMSGDWIPIDLAAKILERDVAVFSLGGATEASIWSIYYPVKQIEKHWKSIPYGFPLKNQSIYVLDKLLQSRPDNVAGEIYIGGVGVAKGYWKDEKKTKNSFILHPKTKERLYRTGDWGIRRDEGFVEFIGREDNQVKIRGYRIELGEIEAVLEKHPLIERALVVVSGETNKDKRIISYIVADGDALDIDNVKEYVEQYLPEYMVPGHFILIDEIPLTPIGKVDRKSLAPPTQVAEESSTNERPVTLVEKQISDCWQEIFDLDEIYRHDNFFALGGTSFTAVRLIVDIAALFKIDIQLSALMNNATLYQLACYIDELLSTRDKTKPNTEEDSSTYNLIKLTDSQLLNQYWFHPSGGNILCYQDLANSLARVVSVSALQSDSDFVNDDAGNNTIESMVRKYVQQIIAFQPDGPYHLSGWSLGGILAYEAAQQLIARGRKVESLIIVDSPAPLSRKMVSDRELVESFISDISSVQDLPDLTCIHGETNNLNEYLLAAMKKVHDLGVLEFFDANAMMALFKIFQRNITALCGYNAEPLGRDVDSLLIMAKEYQENQIPSNSFKVWRSLLPKRTKTHHINGNHYNLLTDPRLEQVTAHIRRFLHNVI